jgi:hypothetical protein
LSADYGDDSKLEQLSDSDGYDSDTESLDTDVSSNLDTSLVDDD